MIYVLTIGVPVAAFIIGCAVIVRRKIDDGDVPLFREHTGRHTPEAVALASLQALRPGPPYPAASEPVPAVPVIEPAAIMPAPVPDPGPEAVIIAAGTVDADGRLTSASIAVLPPLPAPVTESTRPSYVTDEIGDRSVDAWLESAYTRALALELCEQLADEAAS